MNLHQKTSMIIMKETLSSMERRVKKVNKIMKVNFNDDVIVFVINVWMEEMEKINLELMDYLQLMSEGNELEMFCGNVSLMVFLFTVVIIISLVVDRINSKVV